MSIKSQLVSDKQNNLIPIYLSLSSLKKIPNFQKDKLPSQR